MAPLQSRGHTPSSGTTTALVAGLAGSQQGQRAAALLGELGGLGAHGGTDGGLAPAYNLVTRALARQGKCSGRRGM
ncbi:hypothetical protein PLESTF_000830900 [Pleodorina starrii]|nr:hypothetical protein PLESTM_000897600 [Pleodorina starrii]GLC69440.1 hypothetical protein PLESTF_000830900 [Pleodorina starrii]